MTDKMLYGVDALQNDHARTDGYDTVRCLQTILLGSEGHARYRSWSPRQVIYHPEFAHAMFGTRGADAIRFGLKLVKENDDDPVALHNIFTYDNTLDAAKQIPKEVRQAAGMAWVSYVKRWNLFWSYDDLHFFTEKARKIDDDVAVGFENLAVAAGTYTQVRKDFPHHTAEIEKKAWKEIRLAYSELKTGGITTAGSLLRAIANDEILPQSLRQTASVKLDLGEKYRLYKKNRKPLSMSTWLSPGFKAKLGMRY